MEDKHEANLPKLKYSNLTKYLIYDSKKSNTELSKSVIENNDSLSPKNKQFQTVTDIETQIAFINLFSNI